MKHIIADVTIVGSGLVGPTLALELGWRGQSCMVLEQGSGVVTMPRTGSMSVRTMEHYRRLGIAERIRSIWPEDYKLDVAWCTSLTGFELARQRVPAMRDTSAPKASPERRQRAPQTWLDPLVQTEAARYEGVRFSYGTRVERFEAKDDRVLAYARDVSSDDVVTVESSFLVGCDGYDSLVRSSLDIEMMGVPLLDYAMSIFFKCEGLVERTGTEEAERWVLVDESAQPYGYISAVDGSELWRMVVIGGREKFDLATFDANAWLTRAIGHADIGFEVLSVAPWKRSARVANQFGTDRVFIAGDAAHTMSPTGGFGANTGVEDVANLAWKLSATLDGWGGPYLLESYDAERRPVALRTALMAGHEVARFDPEEDISRMLEDSPPGRELRQRVGRRLISASDLGHKGYSMPATTSSAVNTLGVILGYRYEESPICVADGTEATPDIATEYIPSSRPGSRAPHVWLRDGRSTLDLFGRGFVLLRLGGAQSDVSRLLNAAAAHQVPVTVVDLAEPAVLAEYERDLVLVRPDGHVVWRGNDLDTDPMRLLDTVRGAVKLRPGGGGQQPRQASTSEWRAS